MKEVTYDEIVGWFNEQVRVSQPISPIEWLTGAQRLNVLLGGEQNTYWDMAQEVANLRKLRIEDGDTVAKAKVYVESTDEFRNMQKQKAKIERGIELIRLSKQMSRSAGEEMRGY